MRRFTEVVGLLVVILLGTLYFVPFAYSDEPPLQTQGSRDAGDGLTSLLPAQNNTVKPEPIFSQRVRADLQPMTPERCAKLREVSPAPATIDSLCQQAEARSSASQAESSAAAEATRCFGDINLFATPVGLTPYRTLYGDFVVTCQGLTLSACQLGITATFLIPPVISGFDYGDDTCFTSTGTGLTARGAIVGFAAGVVDLDTGLGTVFGPFYSAVR